MPVTTVADVARTLREAGQDSNAARGQARLAAAWWTKGEMRHFEGPSGALKEAFGLSVAVEMIRRAGEGEYGTLPRV